MGYVKKFINKIFYRPKICVQGENNVIKFSKTAQFRRFKVEIYGSNNTVIVDDNSYVHNSKLIIGFPEVPAMNCKVHIGKKCGINSMLMQLAESNSSITMGDDCMVADDVEINCTDHHAIFNNEDKLINKGSSLVIGSHVWLCRRVTIMKNSIIPDGCIVGACSLVAKKFDKKNCVIAGNPAKIVKENIHWDRKRPECFLPN